MKAYSQIIFVSLLIACLGCRVEAENIKTTSAAAASDDTYHVLPAEQFFGAAQMGYTAAKLAPEYCAKLFCYCGCDLTDSHGRLLDCFEGYHGVDCHICVEEAMEALSCKREGKTIAETQQTVDKMFSDKYPFQQESDKLKRYKAARLYKPDLAAEARQTAARAQDPNRRPIIPGKTPAPGEPGSCCSKDAKQ